MASHATHMTTKMHHQHTQHDRFSCHVLSPMHWAHQCELHYSHISSGILMLMHVVQEIFPDLIITVSCTSEMLSGLEWQCKWVFIVRRPLLNAIMTLLSYSVVDRKSGDWGLLSPQIAVSYAIVISIWSYTYCCILTLAQCWKYCRWRSPLPAHWNFNNLTICLRSSFIYLFIY